MIPTMIVPGRDLNTATGHGNHVPGLRAAGRLADLARRRRLPLLVMIDTDGRTLASSVMQDALSSEGDLLVPVLDEARRLVSRVDDGRLQDCSLVLVDKTFYCVRLFPLWAYGAAIRPQRFAVLIEPVVEAHGEAIDFARFKAEYRLSNRETDVLCALMSGGTDKEIARAVGLSASTTRAYLKSIRAKLGVTTRTAIVHAVHQFSG